MRSRQVISLMLIICFSNTIHAQEKPEMITKIERIFREKEPAWKVERVYVKNASDPFHQSIVFRSGGNQAAVDVSIWSREKDAQDVFAGESIAFGNTMGKRMVKSRLVNLGDESHMWTNRGSTAWPTIKFRKGNVNVTVFAPSVAIAKRFAKYVFEQMAAS